MVESPILLTGVYRSGTTILSCMLGAHPSINFTYGTVNYLRWFVKKGVPATDYKKIVFETKDRLLRRFDKEINYDKIVQKIESSSKAICHETIYSAIMADFFAYEKKRWGEKTLLEWTSIPNFLEMYPSGKVLHIIRDPRDVVASFKGMTFENGSRYLDAIFACMHSMDTCTHYRQSLQAEHYYDVSYEKLVQNAASELEKICVFLNIPYHEDMLNENLYTDQLGKKFDRKSHTSHNDSNKPIGRWREKLDVIELELIEGFLSNQMKEFGYNNFSGHGKNVQAFLNLICSEQLLKDRLVNFLVTGGGCEEYPSDPTKEENWTVLGERSTGAASFYLKNTSLKD